jgi:cell division septum initiation protein DivIVA
MCPVAGTATTPTTPAHAAGDGQIFDTALRGYERRQVDEYVGDKSKEISRLTMELAEANRQRRLATEHAEATEKEMRELRARSAHSERAVPEDSFGFRAEKLLRMAEQEAAEVRVHASRESAAIVEKARSEAEKHRHEAEQALISRASLLEQQAAQRAAELQDREQQIADQLAAAREQAEQVHAAAARAADRLRQESEAAAEETRIRAETAAARQRDQASQEIGRLSALQSDVRAELARLAQVLSAELSDARSGKVVRDNPADSSSSGDESVDASSSNGRQR